MKYGAQVSGYGFGVVNEREVRAAAGIMFLLGILTFLTVLFTRDFTLLYVLVPLFWLDFLLKTVWQPKYSLFGFLGGRLVSGQRPEYVGAIQKRFAWGIGLILASIMLVFAIGFGVRGVLPLTICTVCLFFMWMEAALGICVGCKIYKFLLEKKILPEPKVLPTCPGGACSLK